MIFILFQILFKTTVASPLPKEKLCVIHPLVDEVGSDGLRVVLEVHVVQRVDEQGRVVVQSSNSHLQTHGPQLAGLHALHQTLQNSLHKQRDALHVRNTDTLGCCNSRVEHM